MSPRGPDRASIGLPVNSVVRHQVPGDAGDRRGAGPRTGRDELVLLDTVRLAPVIFQEYAPAQADIRVTVVGEQMSAAAITGPQDGYELDYRMNLGRASFNATAIPAGVQAKIARLLIRLGLVYGAVDLRLTPQREYVFLEVNPAGEWLFVEDRTRQSAPATAFSCTSMPPAAAKWNPETRSRPEVIRADTGQSGSTSRRIARGMSTFRALW